MWASIKKRGPRLDGIWRKLPSALRKRWIIASSVVIACVSSQLASPIAASPTGMSAQIQSWPRSARIARGDDVVLAGRDHRFDVTEHAPHLPLIAQETVGDNHQGATCEQVTRRLADQSIGH